MDVLANIVTGKKAEILNIVDASECKPHLITSQKGFSNRPVVTVHISKDIGSRSDRYQLLSKLRECDSEIKFQTASHSSRRMVKAKTLEELLSGYASDDILHDPTGAFSRSYILMEFAAEIRKDLGQSCVDGVYWDSVWNTLYLVLNPEKYFKDDYVKTADLAAAEKTAMRVLKEKCGGENIEFIRAIRLSFEMPAIPLVPVDKKSHLQKNKLLFAIRGYAKASVFAAMLAIGPSVSLPMSAAAEEGNSEGEPAVSSINGKFSIDGGISNDSLQEDYQVGLVTGSLTTPLSHSYGAQIDGFVGEGNSELIMGVGGHLFWRDPAFGLLGVTGGYSELNKTQNQTVSRFGAEGELYLSQFTLSAHAGHQFGYNLPSGFYGEFDVGWYATEDLEFSIGAAIKPEEGTMATASFEYQPAFEGFSGLTFFADGTLGENNHSSIIGGIRFYFGKGPTLMDRHRKDSVPLRPILATQSIRSY